MRSIPRLTFVLTATVVVLVAHAQDIQLKPVQIPNDILYWHTSGFAEMVPPMRLPTDRQGPR
jgi:hypothetical protein